jgi:hypothetical protein
MHRHTVRSAATAVALLATLLLAAPVWAAKPPDAGAGTNGNGAGNDGGNQGSVSVVDAELGLESLTDNESHACGFFLSFHGAPNGESGWWSIVDWPPTGTGVQVLAGTYAIPAGGSFLTATYELDAGHYRVNWQAVNAQGEKHKSFWVDASCFEEDTTPPDPVDEPEDEPQDEPEDQPEEQEQPVDEPQDEPEGDVEDSLQESPAEDNTPTEDQPLEEPVSEEEEEDLPDADQAPSTDGVPVATELPDSAMPMPPVLPGMGIALGLLFLVAAHRTLMDQRRPDKQ